MFKVPLYFVAVPIQSLARVRDTNRRARVSSLFFIVDFLLFHSHFRFCFSFEASFSKLKFLAFEWRRSWTSHDASNISATHVGGRAILPNTENSRSEGRNSLYPSQRKLSLSLSLSLFPLSFLLFFLPFFLAT